MGASSSLPSVTRTTPPQCSHSIHLVTHALPILGELAKQLGTGYTYTDRRWEFLRTFHTAATILLDRLGAIEEAEMTSHYELSITELAILLEELLDDDLTHKVNHKVGCVSCTTVASQTRMPLACIPDNVPMLIPS
jgi:hypothetical protein